MVVYAITSNVSVAGLFMAGVIPGIMMGVGMMAIAYVIARRRGYHPRTERIPGPEVRRRVFEAVPALVAPVIIIGGILLGVVTLTEAGALGVFYAALVGFLVTRELRWRTSAGAPPERGHDGDRVHPDRDGQRGVVAAHGSAGAVPRRPTRAGAVRQPLGVPADRQPLALVVGCFLDNIAAMIMLAPILAPIAVSYGIDPLHFGFIFVMNGVIGMLTPFGILLFVVCGMAKIQLTVLSRAVLPYVAWQMAVLLLCTYIPPLAMWIPRLLGYTVNVMTDPYTEEPMRTRTVRHHVVMAALGIAAALLTAPATAQQTWKLASAVAPGDRQDVATQLFVDQVNKALAG